MAALLLKADFSSSIISCKQYLHRVGDKVVEHLSVEEIHMTFDAALSSLCYVCLVSNVMHLVVSLGICIETLSAFEFAYNGCFLTHPVLESFLLFCRGTFCTLSS